MAMCLPVLSQLAILAAVAAAGPALLAALAAGGCLLRVLRSFILLIAEEERDSEG